MRPAFLYCWRGCFVVQLKCFSSSDPSMAPIGKIQSLYYMYFLCLKREDFFFNYYFSPVAWTDEVKHGILQISVGFFIPLVKRECVCGWGKILRCSVRWHLSNQLLGCQKLGFLSALVMKTIKSLHDFSVWNQGRILTLPEVSQRSFL